MIHLAGFHWVRHSGHLVATCCERHHLRVAGMFQSAGGRHRNDGWYRGIIPEWMAELCHQNTFLYIYILVSGLEHEFYDFPSIWEFHHPNWRTPWFFRGVGIPPTRYNINTLGIWLVRHAMEWEMSSIPSGNSISSGIWPAESWFFMQEKWGCLQTI